MKPDMTSQSLEVAVALLAFRPWPARRVGSWPASVSREKSRRAAVRSEITVRRQASAVHDVEEGLQDPGFGCTPAKSERVQRPTGSVELDHTRSHPKAALRAFRSDAGMATSTTTSRPALL